MYIWLMEVRLQRRDWNAEDHSGLCSRGGNEKVE